MLTPYTPPGRGQPCSDPFLSPSTSCQSVAGVAPAITVLHDDNVEKLQRRKSIILEIAQKNLCSPGTPNRNSSHLLNGLSSSQLADHYSNCIMLSTENKINANNAFELHLIDYMTDLMKKKELENFQVASTTLDASAKIYAGRVDAIHMDTYKVLSSLSQGAGKGNNSDDGAENKELHGDIPKQQKIKKRNQKSKTIETNLKNLNVDEFELEYQMDPVFKKLVSAFDEYGSSGLLLNMLSCYNDRQEIVLDSSMVICEVEQKPCSDTYSQPLLDLTEIKSLFDTSDFFNRESAAFLKDSKLVRWDGKNSLNILPASQTQNSRTFSLDAEPVINDDEDEFMDEEDGGETAAGENGNQETDAYFGKDPGSGDSFQSTIGNIQDGSVMSLSQVISSEPSEYSYFGTNLLQMWAGPVHWRAGPLSRAVLSSSASKNKTKKSVKAPAFRINYDPEELPVFDRFFKKARSNSLTKNTINKYSKEFVQLPVDLHYRANCLFQTFLKPSIMIQCQVQRPEGVDDAVQNYDYENANDKNNYCPANEQDDDNNYGGDSSTSDAVQPSLFIGSDCSGNLSSDLFSSINNTILAGSNLVAMPNKVEKIDISYAKAAKRLNMHKLKLSMWELMTGSFDNDKGNRDATAAHDGKKVGKLNGKVHFKNLVEELPRKVSSRTAKNLSVPVAFVCLLHLANERGLEIINCDLGDLEIFQP